MRLHTNKLAGTRRLTPIPAYFDIVLAHTIRTKSQKLHVHLLVDVGNALIIFASTQSACAQMYCHCMNNRKIISFLCVRINWSTILSQKRRVYELIGYMNY